MALKIREVPITSLKGAEWNPRIMPERELEKLAKSLTEFGFVEPVVVNTRSGLVVGGHQRIEAARRLDLDMIPIVEVDLEPAKEKALNLALNKIHGQWEPEKLADLLQSLDDDEVALAGFDDRELGSLEDVYFQRRMKVEADPDDPPPPEDTETELGDIWTLGNHTLVCGDARVPQSYAAIAKKSTALISDPPYGVAYVSPNGRTVPGDIPSDDDPRLIHDLIYETLTAARPALIDRAVFYLFSPTTPAQIGHLMGVADAEGFTHRQTIVWVKNQASLNIGLGAHYLQQHEAIIDGIAADERHDEDAERTKAARVIMYGATGPNPYWAASRGETSALLYDRPHAQKLHPTEKPIELLERLMRNSTRRGDQVLDPFAGSGSIMVAAENRRRSAAMIELDPRYCDVIVNRYRDLTGKKGRKRHDAKLAKALTLQTPDPREEEE